MTHWPDAGRYYEHEVEALIDHYLDLRWLKHRPSIHVRLLDLERVMRFLPRKLFEAVLVYGMLRFQADAAAEALHISKSAVLKRYRQGVEELLYHLNGEW